jgi:hypothetical protein
MGLDTNELDTREEDLHRTNHTLQEWEYEEEQRRIEKLLEKEQDYETE